ncbi:MAG: hypothetical protein B7Z81_04110 [Acidocella sp. 20-61-6]|nr:MAG: hypothetical protein B7Z81_04110 [Acidocella sp. 20-61-6]
MTEEIDNDIENWQRRAELAEAALAETKSMATAKLIHAELKVEAIRAGMVDLDGLKLLDSSEFVLDRQGEVAGASGIVAGLKRAKPWLFGQGVSSSAAAHAPRPEAPRTRHANELSYDEWLTARAALLRRR